MRRYVDLLKWFEKMDKEETMADTIMMFPDTVEEFMEQYKIVDTEKVYTNGSELIPIFRIKQWFDHIRGVPSAERRGRWVEEPSTYISATGFVCSVCGERSPDGAEYPYCPWCGAKMGEVKDE